MRISDWSSDVCSSDLIRPFCRQVHLPFTAIVRRNELSFVSFSRRQDLAILLVSARHVDVYRINVIDIVRVVVDSFRYPPKRFHANTSFIRLGLAPSRGSGRNEMVADEDNIRRRFQRLHGLTERPLQPFDRSLQGAAFVAARKHLAIVLRSEEHTSELQSLMRSTYAVFCLKKQKEHITSSRY